MSVKERYYWQIAAAVEQSFAQHGDNFRGMDWWKEEDALARHKAMIEVVQRDGDQNASLLDLGCGAGHFLEYLRREGFSWVDYSGADISNRFVELCRSKFPGVAFYDVDVLQDPAFSPDVDYVVMNGLFTVKRSIPHALMMEFLEAMITRAFKIAKRGIAFNTMSGHVDYQQDVHFHVPFDAIASIITKRLGRKFILRHDFLPHEYAVYIYK